MRLFFKKISFFFIGFLLLAYFISCGSLWVLRQSNFYKPAFLANSIKQTNFDYIILGASTGLTTLNTELIDAEQNLKGVNLAVDDTALSSQYLMLQHFLAEGKNTKYCILAPSVSSYNSKTKDVSDNDYRFLMYVNRPYVYNYFNQFSGIKAKTLSYSKYMPAIGVSYYNAEVFFPSVLGLIKPKRRNRFDVNGNYTYPYTKSESQPIVLFKKMPVKFSNSYVKKIKDLCELNNIKLICYMTPMEGTLATIESSDYYVINHSNLLKDKQYFHDAIHVNTLGRKKASMQFSKDLNAIINQ